MDRGEKKVIEAWIRDCMMEYVGSCLPGLKEFLGDGYDYDRGRLTGRYYNRIGEYWYSRFCDSGLEFKEFMKDIDLGGYMDRFEEDFEVRVVFIEYDGEGRSPRLDIEVDLVV